MPVMNGFDVLRQLDAESRPSIIFVTAYDQYAIKAFDVCAVDYLLKPYSTERWQQAVDRVVVNKPGWEQGISEVLKDIPSEKYLRQIPVRHLKRIRLLNVEEISRVVSEHRLVNIYDREGRRLAPDVFFAPIAVALLIYSLNLKLSPGKMAV